MQLDGNLRKDPAFIRSIRWIRVQKHALDINVSFFDVRGWLLMLRCLHPDLQDTPFVDFFDAEDVAVKRHDSSFVK